MSSAICIRLDSTTILAARNKFRSTSAAALSAKDVRHNASGNQTGETDH